MTDGNVVRSRWIDAYCVYLVVIWALQALTFSEHMEISWQSLAVLFVALPTAISIGAYPLYYCAYRKGGTRLLGLSLVLSPLKAIPEAINALKETNDIVVFLVMIFAMMPWLMLWIRSYRLRQLNLANKNQNRKLENHEQPANV